MATSTGGRGPARARTLRKGAPEVLRLHVTLLDVEPAVWRRVEVPAGFTFGELHHVLQLAMGWENEHLHQFLVEERRLGVADLDDGEVEDDRRVRLGELLAKGARLTYAYDFGDGWEHEILVEERRPIDRLVAYPVCTGGARACPPESVGGPGGYADFLEALADPDDERHEQLRGWIGGIFDPEGFDLNGVNRAIRRRA